MRHKINEGEGIMGTKKIILKKKGFSLVGVLVASGIFSVMSLAMFKTLQISFNSQAVLNSIFVTQDLKHSMRKAFQSGSCSQNMATVSGDSIAELKDHSLSTPVTLVKSGEAFREKLNIAKIEITSPLTTNPAYKKLTVYYSRKGLSSLSTRGDNPCSGTDLSGCYAENCHLRYEPSVSCDLLNCSNLGSNSVAGLFCGPGEYLKGFDTDGNKICENYTIMNNITTHAFQCNDCGTRTYNIGNQKFCALSVIETGGFESHCRVRRTVGDNWEINMRDAAPYNGEGQLCEAICFN